MYVLCTYVCMHAYIRGSNLGNTKSKTGVRFYARENEISLLRHYIQYDTVG
jgi:hypothetical protein